MGRGSDSDIKISDISVSRSHAIITRENGNYYIEDRKSKFGTLCKVKSNLILDKLD